MTPQIKHQKKYHTTSAMVMYPLKLDLNHKTYHSFTKKKIMHTCCCLSSSKGMNGNRLTPLEGKPAEQKIPNSLIDDIKVYVRNEYQFTNSHHKDLEQGHHNVIRTGNVYLDGNKERKGS